MGPDGCSAMLKEARRAGRQQAKLWEEKKRHVGCTRAANEPVGASGVSQAWPALLQTLASPLRWQVYSCFMLFWHRGCNGEHYILKKCILFFFPFWSIKLQFDFRVKFGSILIFCKMILSYTPRNRIENVIYLVER